MTSKIDHVTAQAVRRSLLIRGALSLIPGEINGTSNGIGEGSLLNFFLYFSP
jgi:hypothetical protein